MKSLHKLLAAVTMMAFLLGSLPARQVHAAVIEVNATADSGPGSLRQAVIDADSGSTITFAPNLAGQTITLTGGQIGIDKQLTIDGSGLDPHVKISGENLGRVFNVTGSWIVNISHVDIIGGNAADGGAIYNSANTLAITDVAFANNQASNGGAIYNGGNLTITNSTFSDNSANYGGAIYHFDFALTVTKSTFNSNTVEYSGGAIYNSSTRTGMKIANSIFSNNWAKNLNEGRGGAIYNAGDVTVINKTTFSGNETDKDGGGIYNNGTITRMAVNAFSGNNALVDGGGIYNDGTITILYRSTFSGNSADYGGGISNRTGNADLFVANSTFSGNDAYYEGGGIKSDGLLRVINATFSENVAGKGGGIYAAVDPVTLDGFILINTILANSPLGDDCYNNSGDTITINKNNLIEVNGPLGHRCGIPALAEDPSLGPLADNGFKRTKTHMLNKNSPAIDAGDDNSCRDIDQRGKPRPVDFNLDGSATNCDIGAVERQRTIEVLKLRSQAAYDGDVLETGENSNVGGKINDFDFNMKAGDNNANQQFRSILSFDTGKLVDRAVVTRVVVKVKKAAVLGTNPFDFSDLVADIRRGSFSGNRALESTDFQAFADMAESSMFDGTPLPGGWYKGVLKLAARRYVYKKGLTQFRLRFKPDDNNNGKNDYIMFYTGDADSSLNRPLLIVRYYLP